MYCQFASASDSDAVEREGVAPLSELSELVSRARRVVVLLAASDVTLLRVKVPPLSAARLRAALPNLVEDQLMSDPAECVVVAGGAVGDTRTVAVVQRNWLELINRSLVALGARSIAAIPSQLCLPASEDGASAAIVEYGNEVEVVVRLGEQEGIGLPVFADQPELAPLEAMQALCAVVPQAPIALAVPPARVRQYEDALTAIPEAAPRVALAADSWQRWIAGARQASIDLMIGLGASAGPKLDWRPWRWPLVLAGLILLIHTLGMNIDWLRKKREADGLRNAMVQIYRSAFPNETAILDPVAQLRQKIAVTQRESGQIAPDDFLALAAGFTEAWTGIGQKPDGIGGIEYRDRALTVKLKQGGEAPLEQLRTALAARNLSVTEAGSGVLQIRSAK